jgi:hypothetical protein
MDAQAVRGQTTNEQLTDRLMERSYDTRFVVVCVTTHVPCTSGIDDQVLSAVDKKGLVAKGKAVFARFDDKLHVENCYEARGAAEDGTVTDQEA